MFEPWSDLNSNDESKSANTRHIGILSVVRIFLLFFVSLVVRDFLRLTQHH